MLRRHCKDVGRNYDEIVRSTSVQVHLLDEGDDPERATAQVRGRQSYEDFAEGTIVGTPDAVTDLFFDARWAKVPGRLARV